MKRSLILLAALACGLVSGAASPALAGGRDQELINQLTVQLQTLESSDPDKVLTTDLGLAKAWIGEAQAALTQEKELEFDRAIKRVRAAVALMDAKVKKAAQSRKTDAARGQAEAMGREVEKLRAEITKLEGELAGLSANVEKTPAPASPAQKKGAK